MGKTEKIKPERALKIDDLEAYPKFKAEIIKLETLCRLSKIEKPKEKAQATKNYIIMRLVGVSEKLLKSMVSDFIDKFKISAKSFGGGMTLDLDQLDEIQSEDITKGKIIASTLGLANAVMIGVAFGNINNFKPYTDWNDSAKQFFTWIQELSPVKKGERDLFEEFDELLKKRNKIAHGIDDYLDVIDTNKIRDWYGLLMMMWFATDIHLSRNRKDMKKKHAIECEDMFKMNIKEFNEITSKYSKV